MICGHGHGQKFKYPYSRESKIIQMAYPRAKAMDQIPALCPASPPRRLDIDRCIIYIEWTLHRKIYRDSKRTLIKANFISS